MAPITRSRAAQTTWDDPFALNHPQSTPASPVFQTDATSSISSLAWEQAPPIYTIDLSLPPSQRYVQVAQDFKLIIVDLAKLYDDILDMAQLPKKTFHIIARCVLRKLYSKEQTEELRGIAEVTGVALYLLVAYNVLLDLFMGCTSGGIVVKEARERQGKMMHFRTLDWGMPSLRKGIVQLKFKNGANGHVIARTISYVGFVGTLTGVRKGLSVSLNFRPYHNNDGSKWANVKFYSHFLAVLLGWRPSICAHLRDLIIPTGLEKKKRKAEVKKESVCDRSNAREDEYKYTHSSLADIALDFPVLPTTAAYLTFCDGNQTLVLEKDRVTAKPMISSSFITVTNHDTSYEPTASLPVSSSSAIASASQAHEAHANTQILGSRVGMDVLVSESLDRKSCLVSSWENHVRAMEIVEGRQEHKFVELEMLKDWLLEYPVVNEQTHFVAVMDPSEGYFRWVMMLEEGEIDGEE